jgi:dTDP-glucose 4,6-dehydratase
MQAQRYIVTGGAGFIGSALVRHLVDGAHEVLNFDCLTYAGDLRSVESVAHEPSYQFLKASICDAQQVKQALSEFRPQAIIHCAAETHVDRSIDGPAAFIDTNVMGTFNLLSAALHYWETTLDRERDAFRFLQVSTDEVFGELSEKGAFTPDSLYRPRSPYSASKAAADHLVMAWHATYGLPCLIANCSNNFGPYQHPEKLIPTVIYFAVREAPIPIYGKGLQVRDWLYVSDHAAALELIAAKGRLGEQYLVGARNDMRNIDLVEEICAVLDRLRPRSPGRRYRDLITFVDDRPGHDYRYAVDPTKLEQELGWRPRRPFRDTLTETVKWFLDNPTWLEKRVTGPERQGLRQAQTAAQAD